MTASERIGRTDTVRAATQAALHPWNHGFDQRRTRSDRRLLTDDQARQFDEDGYLRLDEVLDLEDLAAVRAAIDPHERKVNDFLATLEGGRFEVAIADALTVTLHPSVLDDRCRSFCLGAPFDALVHDLIGDRVRLYWDQAVYKLPHNLDPVPWHQDNGYVYIEPQAYLTVWVPLVDATVDNGCVWVVPGAHRRGTLAHEHTDLGRRCLPESTVGAVAVEAAAGSAVVFSSLTPHRTGPNVTDEVRAAYILQYIPDGAEILQDRPDSQVPERVTQNADRQPLIRTPRAGEPS